MYLIPMLCSIKVGILLQHNLQQSPGNFISKICRTGHTWFQHSRNVNEHNSSLINILCQLSLDIARVSWLHATNIRSTLTYLQLPLGLGPATCLLILSNLQEVFKYQFLKVIIIYIKKGQTSIISNLHSNFELQFLLHYLISLFFKVNFQRRMF